MERELIEALETAFNNTKDLNARAYINAIQLAEKEGGEEGIKVQILYILNNLQYWRGQLARETKKTLKRYC